jgi:hypothetical protein
MSSRAARPALVTRVAIRQFNVALTRSLDLPTLIIETRCLGHREDVPVKLILLRSSCDNARICPNINATDRGTLVVQGYAVPNTDVAALVDDGPMLLGGVVVEVPLALLPELAGETTARPGLFLTDRGTVLVSGQAVTDAEVLAELSLPAGESAVEVPITALPELTVGGHA